jgi:hypothetical protein
MTSVLLPIFLFAVWMVWIPVCLLERRARGESGHFSAVPVIPVFPLVAWGLAVVLDWIYNRLGLLVIGGLHALLLLAFLISVARSLYVIRRNRRSTKS